MAGASLGGGIGFYSSMFGAISDSLLSIEMVVASGELVTASESHNPELFWAMKGAGANFGVAISLTYKLYDSPNEGKVLNADMMFPISQNGTIWAYAKSWIGRQPRELSLSFAIGFDATAQQVGHTIHFNEDLLINS